jgi:hypothetical protein
LLAIVRSPGVDLTSCAPGQQSRRPADQPYRLIGKIGWFEFQLLHVGFNKKGFEELAQSGK